MTAHFFIDENRFLRMFRQTSEPTFRQYMELAVIVRHNGTKIPLKNLIGNKLTQTEAKLLYDSFLNRETYLRAFYRKSLNVGSVVELGNEKPMTIGNMNNNLLVKYKNVIRNMFWKEILKETKSGVANVPSYWEVVWGFYKKCEIDYKLVTPSALHYMRENFISSNFSSFYFRASIMNPYLVYSLQKKIFSGGRVFSPTLGWGSYAYGFCASGEVEYYVGVDVIPQVCERVGKFLGEYFPRVKQEILCVPSEKLAKNVAFLRKYAGWFDTVFFSPPYFQLEMYSGEMQSTLLYRTFEEWLEMYWKPTLELCFHVLKRGGVMCFIISDYEGYSLVKTMGKIAVLCGFVKTRQMAMKNKQVFYRETERQEQMLFFTK